MAAIDTLFQVLLDKEGSDLHLTSHCPPMIREHGEMHTLENTEPITPDKMRALLTEIAPKANWDEFEKTGDTDFAYALGNKARFRANLFLDQRGPGAVFRVIPSKILSVTDLKLPKAVMELCNLSKGLVVVTGPTGSGKTTTLAAMVDHINATRKEHIITIEDPVEFVYPNRSCLVNQREVRRHTQSFKKALRAALREDPDIVVIGEMRDQETVEIALETAETGHLVFGTLHTTTAPSTVDRIIDQFPEDRQSQIRTMLSSSLKGVIAQVLCRKITRGRVAALEILLGNSAVSSYIREAKTYQIPSAMQVAGKQGMRLLNESLAELVKDKIVDAKEAYLKAVDKEDFKKRVEGFPATTAEANSMLKAA